MSATVIDIQAYRDKRAGDELARLICFLLAAGQYARRTNRKELSWLR